MTTFHIAKSESFKGFNFGRRLLDIVIVLSLPTPFIKGSEMTKFHKKGIWVINITQPGHETELKTEEIKFKNLNTDREMSVNTLIQELIACLCVRHSSELQDHYSYIFGRHDDKGDALELPNDIVDPMRTHFAVLEDLIRDVEVEGYNEMFNNNELRAQLKQYQEQEKRIKEMEEKFEAREKKRKSQENRIQARNKEVRKLKQKLECNNFELAADHDLIEKLHAERRELQEKVDTLAEDVQDYKRLLNENGFDIEEEEVFMEE
jgi:DNA repair exonuclease SbcCD ATPase subunit